MTASRTMRERFDALNELRERLGIPDDANVDIRLTHEKDSLVLFGRVSAETRAFSALLGPPTVNLSGWAEWQNETSRVTFTGWSDR